MIAFLCAGCGKSLKVKDEFAGRKGRCPHCQKPMTVPTTEATSPDADYSESDAKTVLPPALDAEMDTKTVLPSAPSRVGPAASKTSPGAKPAPAAPRKAAPKSEEAELYDFLAPPQAADEIGRLGSYRVLKVLGAGGMGVVFQAEDPKLSRLVALKAMLPALAASGSNKERFLREARAAAAIEHDHIVAIFQVDEDRGVPFIAMPFLRGESLEDRLKKQRKLPIPEALRIAKETAEGLAAAHERNMIHRDIKPANVWLEGEKGRVKILDFGLARSARGESQLTQQGAIIGTPQYMAPEQGAGKPVDTRCDLFSLGCMMYRMVTGQLPFKGADTVSTLVAVATETPVAPRKLNPELSPRQSKLIMELLAKDPMDRPPSALSVVELIEELEKEPPQDQTAVMRDLVAHVPAARGGDLDEVLPADDLDEVQPAGRSMLVPLLIGGVVLLLGLIGVGIIGAVLFFKGDNKSDVASNTNPADNRPIDNPPPPPPPPVLNNPRPGDNVRPPAGVNDPVRPKAGGDNPGGEDPPAIRPPIRPRKEGKEADKTFRQYSSRVMGLLFTPDGAHFVTFAERNNLLHLWERETGKIARTFDLGAGVRHALLSADGSRLIAYNDAGLKCFDTDSGQQLALVTPLPGMRVIGGGFTADKDVRAALAVQGGGAFGVVIYDDTTKKLIPQTDPKTNKPIIDRKTKQSPPLIFPHATNVQQVFFGPDAKTFLSWSQDRTFRSWDIEGKKLVNTFPAAPNMEKSLAISGDFKRLLGTFHESNVHLYDVEAATELKDLKTPSFGQAEAVALGPDNTFICGSFGDVRILDLEGGEVKKELKAGAFVSAVALSPDGKTALAGNSGGTIFLYNLDK